MKVFNTGSARIDNFNDLEEIDDDSEHEKEEDLTDLAPVGKIISKIRNLFRKIRFSEKLREKLKSYCMVEKVDYIEPVSDVKTRWNSTFDMLYAALRLERGLKLLIISVNDLQKYFLSELEWHMLSDINNLLSHFKKVSDLLCGEQYVTLPSVVVAVNFMLDKLEKAVTIMDEKKNRSEIDELFIVAIQAGRDKILKHYRKFNWVYCALLILDPRFKLETFKKTVWGLEMMNCSYDKFKSIFQTYYTDETTHSGQTQSEQNNNVNDFIDDYDGIYATKEVVSTWEIELNAYIMSPRAQKEVNVLQWWKFNAHLYPTLAKMARDYLCIPATSVPCERVFSEAGNVISHKRCSLSKEKAVAQICANMWMKSKLKKKICNVQI